MSLRRSLGYLWHDYVSGDLVQVDVGLREVTCILRERQLRLYWNVCRLHAEHFARLILSCRGPSGWTLPSGRTHLSWLREVQCYLRDMGMTRLASA